jgi:GTP-binding protein
MRTASGGKSRLVFHAPSRGLIGFHGEFLTITRGTGVMNRLFYKYGSFKGQLSGRRNGVLISNGQGEAVSYAMGPLEDRGELFISPGDKVYMGMIVGEHSRDNDLEVNILRAKQLTNFRAAGKDDAIRLSPPRLITLEYAIAYIEEDELVEVTPKCLRLRKKHLDPNDRKRASRSSGN